MRCGARTGLGLLCANFELAGGNIRSIAMATVIHSIQREYQKLGRLTLASEFGPYLGRVQG